MPYALPCSNQTKSSGHRNARDVVRGSEAQDRAGEEHGRQDDPPIDCCVWVGIFLPYFAQGWKQMLYTPPCSNQTKWSRRLIAQDVARRFDALDREREGCGQLDDLPIDCYCVWVGFFHLGLCNQ